MEKSDALKIATSNRKPEIYYHASGDKYIKKFNNIFDLIESESITELLKGIGLFNEELKNSTVDLNRAREGMLRITCLLKKHFKGDRYKKE